MFKQKTRSGVTGNVGSGIFGALLATNNLNEWIIDTGATNHMVSNINMLDKSTINKDNNPRKFYLPNGDISIVTHTGTSSISPRSILENVFLLPQFKYNLMSVSKATEKLHCIALFYLDFCIFQDLSNGKVKEIDRQEDGLYLLNQTTSIFYSEGSCLLTLLKIVHIDC